MTVKELKTKLANIPEDAAVEMVICNNDNPLEDGVPGGQNSLFRVASKGWGQNCGFVPGVREIYLVVH